MRPSPARIAFAALKRAHEALLAAVADDPAAARELLAKCGALGWRELAPLYEAFGRRLAS